MFVDFFIFFSNFRRRCHRLHVDASYFFDDDAMDSTSTTSRRLSTTSYTKLVLQERLYLGNTGSCPSSQQNDKIGCKFNYVNCSYITPKRLFLIFNYFSLSPRIAYYVYFHYFFSSVIHFLYDIGLKNK